VENGVILLPLEHTNKRNTEHNQLFADTHLFDINFFEVQFYLYVIFIVRSLHDVPEINAHVFACFSLFVSF
jgi:hypothetical protein